MILKVRKAFMAEDANGNDVLLAPGDLVLEVDQLDEDELALKIHHAGLGDITEWVSCAVTTLQAGIPGWPGV